MLGRDARRAGAAATPAAVDSELAVYRVVQEALANVLRHAGASRLSLAARNDGGELAVWLIDDGCGFDPGQVGGARYPASIWAWSACANAPRSPAAASTSTRHPGGARRSACAFRWQPRHGHRRGQEPAVASLSHTVLLADDHTPVRAGLRALLEGLPEVSTVLEASDGREALETIAAHHPAVVLMDIAMPGLNGLEAAALVSRYDPGTRTIVLSMHGTDAYVLQALRAGAAGYLLKDAAVAELPLALRAVLRGEITSAAPFPGGRQRLPGRDGLGRCAGAEPHRRAQRTAAGDPAAPSPKGGRLRKSRSRSSGA